MTRVFRCEPIEVLVASLEETWVSGPSLYAQQRDMDRLMTILRQRSMCLVYVTARSQESAIEWIQHQGLPLPDAIIADQGASIACRDDSGNLKSDAEYQHAFLAQTSNSERESLPSSWSGWNLVKEAFSERQRKNPKTFVFDKSHRKELIRALEALSLMTDNGWRWIIHQGRDANECVLELFAAATDLSFALSWWLAKSDRDPNRVLVAGSTWDDFALLAESPYAILVGNAENCLKRAVRQVFYEDRREPARLYAAHGNGVSGVLEGLRWWTGEPSDLESLNRLGATAIHHDATRFLIWAPRVNVLEVESPQSKDRCHRLERREDGWFEGTISEFPLGSDYYLVLDGNRRRPDPASRYQPQGVHGVSRVERHVGFPWTDQQWRGVHQRNLVIYELHVGSFTRSGTFREAVNRLPELVDLGITAIELMPLAASPGGWNWGYDGVHPFAIRQSFGEPDDLRYLVDEAHRLGLGVLVDVVYNHLGPEGNYLAEFAPYFSTRHRTPWGEAFDFDSHSSHAVRRYIVENALSWIKEYHLDGLRLDAVHFMFDESGISILNELSAVVRAWEKSAGRYVHLIAESNVYDEELLHAHPQRSAYSAIWADCLMHSIYSVALPELRLTHRTYSGVRDVAEALQFGYLYEGRDSRRVDDAQRRERHSCPEEFEHLHSLVLALQTHDSVGNHPKGSRLHQLTSTQYQRAAVPLVLLHPAIPMLFMGEENATSAPFPFFVDFEDPYLRRVVDEGRIREYPHHDWSGSLAPSDPRAFFSANVESAPSDDVGMQDWYRQCLKLRHRQLATGRLEASLLRVAHDESLGLIELTYVDSTGKPSWGVITRLVGSDETQSTSIEITLLGKVIAVSADDVSESTDRIQLPGNRAVIWDRLGE